MHTARTLALIVAALTTAFAGSAHAQAEPAPAGMAPMTMAAPGSMTAMEPRMMAMKNMHQKMMAARSPAERQALMAEHMKAMQGGMALMKEKQGGKHAMGGMAGMTSMGDGPIMQAEMAKREQMMSDHTATMQMMMDMMTQRMPASPAAQ